MKRILAILSILLLLFTPTYAIVKPCPNGYISTPIGCVLIKSLDYYADQPIPTSAFTCDNVSHVLKVSNYSFYTLKSYYDNIFGRDTYYYDGYVLANETIGTNTIRYYYACVADLGFYPINGTIKEKIYESTVEVDKITNGIAWLSIFVGTLVAGGLFGGILGMTLSAWAFTILLWLAYLAGWIVLPQFILYITGIVSTILALATLGTIYLIWRS